MRALGDLCCIADQTCHEARTATGDRLTGKSPVKLPHLGEILKKYAIRRGCSTCIFLRDGYTFLLHEYGS